jgi:putative ABC transport system permease protein
VTALALRGLAARKLRSALTATAILLGVAMIAGTYVLTDQIRNAFDDIQAQALEGIDVVVSPKEAFGSDFTQPQTIDEAVVDEVERIEGVDAAHGQVAASGRLVIDGEVVETAGAPSFVFGVSPDRFSPVSLLSGRQPRAPGELSVLQQTAERRDLDVGDRVGLATNHGVRRFDVVGIFAFGEAGSSLGGTSMVIIPPRQLAALYDLRGEVSSVEVIASPGTPPAELAQRIRAALPGSLTVQTAEQSAQEAADEVNDQIGAFLTPALLAFAGAALLVGAFIIFNTFSITVAQRTREFAVLRSLGATRRQVLGAMLAEALLLGAIASALGIALGVVFAWLLSIVFDALGFGIPRSGVVLAPRTVLISLSVGLVVTAASALAPALRATRVPPVAAMSGADAQPGARARRIRAVLTAVAALLGGVLLAQGLFGSGPAASRLAAVGGGVLLTFVAVALSARYVAKPLAAVIGLPLERLFRVPGQLARENAMRNPARTAITSAALMVGVGLVVFVSVFTAGIKSTFFGDLDALVKAEVFVVSDAFEPIPAETERKVAAVPGVSGVASLLYDEIKVDGKKSNALYDTMEALEPEALDATYSFEWIDGGDELIGSLSRNEALVEEQFAKAHDLETGDGYRVETPSGGRAWMTVLGTYRDPTILQGSVVTPETLRLISSAKDPYGLFVDVADSADPTRVQAGIERALADFPTANVQDRAEYKQSIEKQLNQIVYLLYALLAMSVVISLFGIANSLFLSIHERTREFGLLRAVGATTTQVRRVVRYESVITAVIGGLLGTAIGIFFAWVTTRALSEWDVGFSVQPRDLLLVALVAVLVGVVGAIGPARRGSRIDVMAAIRYE